MGMGVGLPFAAGFLLQVAGLNEIPASRSGFLTSLSVAFTPLLMIAMERRRPRIATMIGALIALAGTACLTGLLVPGGRFGLHLAADATASLGLGDALTIAGGLRLRLPDRLDRCVRPADAVGAPDGGDVPGRVVVAASSSSWRAPSSGRSRPGSPAGPGCCRMGLSSRSRRSRACSARRWPSG